MVYICYSQYCSEILLHENTEHFLLNWQREEIIMTWQIFNNINNVCLNFENNSLHHQIKSILSLKFCCSENELASCISITCKFIKQIYNIRFGDWYPIFTCTNVKNYHTIVLSKVNVRCLCINSSASVMY